MPWRPKPIHLIAAAALVLAAGLLLLWLTTRETAPSAEEIRARAQAEMNRIEARALELEAEARNDAAPAAGGSPTPRR